MQHIKFRTLLFIRNMAADYYPRQRGELLYRLDVVNKQKEAFEAANPGKEHGFEWQIKNFEKEIKELECHYENLVGWMKANDADDIIFKL